MALTFSKYRLIKTQVWSAIDILRGSVDRESYYIVAFLIVLQKEGLLTKVDFNSSLSTIKLEVMLRSDLGKNSNGFLTPAPNGLLYGTTFEGGKDKYLTLKKNTKKCSSTLFPHLALAYKKPE